MKEKQRVLVIAEAGVNHNGDINMAFQLVDAAYAAGADVVKFQTFKTENLVTQKALQADYQKKNTKIEQSQYNLLKQLELPYHAHLDIKAYCDSKEITYLSTAFDDDSLDFLVHQMNLTTLKIASGELTNIPFILAHAQTGCNLIVSTGMATCEEIELALSAIAFGYLNSDESPSVSAFKRAYQSSQGQALLKNKVTLLHCTTEYPAPIDEVNLNVLGTLAETFNLPIGYSDHTEGIVVSMAAVAKGACIIEKHFTLDRSLPGPDHQASIEPKQLLAMIEGIRITELALGGVDKKPSLTEQKNKIIARKSIVAKKVIKKGEVLNEDNIGVMRPGSGLSPVKLWQVINSKAIKNFEVGDLIEIKESTS